MNQHLEYYQHIKALEDKIGFNFSNPMIFYQACTHRSYQNEMRNLSTNNERLEFLGDSVLSVVVSDFLYSNFPDFVEGELSFAKSKLVEASACANYAKDLEIDSFLLLGKGEMQNLGKGRESVIADFFEAIIGAIFIDSGMTVVRNFLLEKFSKRWLDMGLKKEDNEKVLLQEYSQKKFQTIPEYHVIS